VDHLYSLYDALVSINVPTDKARALIDAMERDMGTTLATKPDLQFLRQELRQDIPVLATKAEVSELRQEVGLLRHDMDSLTAGLRKDLDVPGAALRNGLEAQASALRQKFQAHSGAIRKDLDVQSAANGQDLNVLAASMRKDLDVLAASVRKDMELLINGHDRASWVDAGDCVRSAFLLPSG
jgi:hypothetical protein